jgi:hypothetical protein
MIDFIKMEAVLFTGVDITANPLLIERFNSLYNEKTFEISRSRVAKYKCLTFKQYDSGRLILSGSLHKYFNQLGFIIAPNQYNSFQIEKGFNGDDFNYTKLRYTLFRLSLDFGIDLNQSRLTNIEFGINAPHELNTSKILHGLLRHNGKTFTKQLDNSFKKLYHSHYRIKAYDKANQYGIKYNLLRFELQYKKMERLNLIGLNYLIDLFDTDLLIRLKDELLKRWDEILFFDYTIDRKPLAFCEDYKCEQFKNEQYWEDLPANRLDRPKKDLQRLIDKYSLNVKGAFTAKINDKWSELNTRCETYQKLFISGSCVTTDSSNTIGQFLHIINRHYVNTEYQKAS